MELSAATSEQLVPRRKSDTLSALRRKEALVGFLFIAPTFILFFIFVAYPLVESLRLSLFKWNIFTPPEFVGLQNYARMPTDAQVIAGFRNTITFAILVVALDVVVALSLAVALQHKIPKLVRNFFRTVYILPVVTSMAAITLVLKFMLNTNLGVVNYYLGQLGIEKIPWLESTNWALLSIVLVTVWKTFGFDLLLFTAGIQNIPIHLYEAAEVDGANAWQKLRYITLPQLSPTIFFVTVVSLISHLQMFDQAQIMTGGGPGDSTMSIVMVIWNNLGRLDYGYGSTIATVFFGFIMLLTIVQFVLSRRWVYYEGGKD